MPGKSCVFISSLYLIHDSCLLHLLCLVVVVDASSVCIAPFLSVYSLSFSLSFCLSVSLSLSGLLCLLCISSFLSVYICIYTLAFCFSVFAYLSFSAFIS